MSRRRVLMVAGEASGDAHAAGLVRALRARGPAVDFVGVGGTAMEAAGVDLLARYDDLAVVGLVEAAAVVPRVLRLLARLRRWIRTERPDLFVPVDSPEINLRLSGSAAAASVPVVYFIAPQVWAWRPGRVRQIRRCTRELLVLFPFEVDWFAAHGVQATYVGHPLVDAAGRWLAEAQASGSDRASSGPETVLLLPGSRRGEVARHLPILAAAVERLRASGRPGLRCTLRMADALGEEDYQPAAARAGIELSRTSLFALAREATAVVSASGTASFEASLMETPTLVIYRVSPLTGWLARRLIRVPSIAMTNLAAGRLLLPELVQEEATPERVAQELAGMLDDPARRAILREELAKLRARFGPAGAYERAAARAAAWLGPA